MDGGLEYKYSIYTGLSRFTDSLAEGIVWEVISLSGSNIMNIKVGDLAPDFTLQSHLDKEVTLSEYRGKTTVLVFFPQAFTPV